MSAGWESEDSQARAAALDPGRSFIVRAPAGSGKTELLVLRFLALLARVDKPESILAITFTRKAAADMKRRVLAAIEEAARPAPTTPHDLQRWRLAAAVRRRAESLNWLLDELPGRLAIETIDSFALRVAGRMPVTTGFGAQPVPCEDADAYYIEAARQTIARLGAPEVSRPLQVLLTHFDNQLPRVQRLIADMLGRRDQWLRFLPESGGGAALRQAAELGLANAVRDGLAPLRGLIPRKCLSNLLSLLRFAAGNLPPDSPLQSCAALSTLPGSDPEDREAWQAIADFLLIKDLRDPQFRKKVNKNIGFPAGSKEEKEQFDDLVADLGGVPGLRNALNAARLLPPPRYSEAHWAVIEAMWDVLGVAESRLRASFRRGEECDFIELTRAAIRALGTDDLPTDLAFALDARIEHILVDEFQDTSFSQWELLDRILSSWDATDRRTLFLVGDPMQSIYGFREAEVGLFLTAWAGRYQRWPLDQLQLRRNFRSRPGVVEWVNRTFAPLFPLEQDAATGAVTYEHSVAAREEPAHFCTALCGRDWLADQALARNAAVVAHAFAAGEYREEAARVVAVVKREQELLGSEARIAILGRSRPALAPVLRALGEANLRYAAVEMHPLASMPVVLDLFALTRALLHPLDRIAWLAVLRAPWCGLSLEDLHTVCADAPDLPLWQLIENLPPQSALPPDSLERLQRLREALLPSMQAARRVPLRRLVEGAWRSLGGPYCLNGKSAAVQAEAYLALLVRLEQSGVVDPETIAEQLDRLYAPPDPLAPGALQVMTIHKAKGLEFDVVILPALDAGSQQDSTRMLDVLRRPRSGGDFDLLLSCHPEEGQDSEPVAEFIQQILTERSGNEERRLAYVAATRAKKRLHLLGKAPFDPDKGVAKPRAGLLRILWESEALAREFTSQIESAAPEESAIAEAPSRPPTLYRLPAGWTLPQQDRIAVMPAREAVAAPRQASVAEPLASLEARKLGNVVHAALLEIARTGLSRWNETRVVDARGRYETALRMEGLPSAAAARLAGTVVDAVLNTITDERGRWILAAHEEEAVEFSLGGLVDDEWVNARIDRTFVENGTRWVIDLKTGLHEGGDIEDFLTRELDTYRAQLDRYGALLRALDERPVRAGIYFPLLRAWREATMPPRADE